MQKMLNLFCFIDIMSIIIENSYTSGESEFKPLSQHQLYIDLFFYIYNVDIFID